MTLKKAKITELVTEDGSLTFHNSTFDEHYHTKSGAIEEAFEKHAKPLGISEINKESIAMLDFCFGLGYNSLAGLAEAIKNPHVKKIKLIAIEIDPDILTKIKQIEFEYDEWELIRELAVTKKIEREYKGKQLDLEILVQDGLIAMKHFPKELFDFVFFDPFSPKKCPELWTAEVFKYIASSMSKDGKLSTYSCARVVKDGLKEAGLERKDGPIIGRRSPSTIAIKH